MTPVTENRLPPPLLPPAVGEYALLAAGSLVLVTLGLVQARMGPWSVLPAVVGGIAILLRWRSAPLLILPAVLLVVLARLQGLDPYTMLVRLIAVLVGWVMGIRFGSPFAPLGLPPRSPSLVAQVFLAAGLLGYFTAAYRLAAVRHGPFPPEPRRWSLPRSRGPQPPPPVPPLPGRAAAAGHLALLLAVAVAGVLAWRWVERREPLLDLPPATGRFVTLAGFLGLAALALAAVLRAAALRRLSREQAALYLQDVAWQETRREQRRIQRWRVWARRRRTPEGDHS